MTTEQQPQEQAEIFLRYIKDENSFEFRMGDNVEAIKFPENAIDKMADGMRNQENGEKQAEVFLMLVDAAKKDSEGRFVSATDLPVKPGQAIVAGDQNDGN